MNDVFIWKKTENRPFLRI